MADARSFAIDHEYSSNSCLLKTCQLMKSSRWASCLAALLSASLLISDAYAQFGGGWGGSRSGRGDRSSRADSKSANHDDRADRQMMSDTLSYEQA
jgi:hypothetical protein